MKSSSPARPVFKTFCQNPACAFLVQNGRKTKWIYSHRRTQWGYCTNCRRIHILKSSYTHEAQVKAWEIFIKHNLRCHPKVLPVGLSSLFCISYHPQDPFRKMFFDAFFSYTEYPKQFFSMLHNAGNRMLIDRYLPSVPAVILPIERSPGRAVGFRFFSDNRTEHVCYMNDYPVTENTGTYLIRRNIHKFRTFVSVAEMLAEGPRLLEEELSYFILAPEIQKDEEVVVSSSSELSSTLA